MERMPKLSKRTCTTLAHLYAGGGEDHPHTTRITVAVVQGAKKSGDDGLRGAEDDVGDGFLTSTRTSFQAEVNQEVLNVRDEKRMRHFVLSHFLTGRTPNNSSARLSEMVCLWLVPCRQPDSPFPHADVAVTDQVTQESRQGARLRPREYETNLRTKGTVAVPATSPARPMI